MTRDVETALFTVDTPFRPMMRQSASGTTTRIVGIDAGDEVLWAPTRHPVTWQQRYSPKKVEEMALPFEPTFRDKLIGFFATYLAKDSGGHKKDFNCHLFGNWMIGAALDTEGPSDVIVNGVKIEALEPGQRGVIGGWWPSGKRVDPAHSVIGLTEEISIQIDGWQGPLKLTTNQQAIDRYVSPDYQKCPSYRGGLYVEQAVKI